MGLETDTHQTRDVLARYDTTGTGVLTLVEFSKLVQERSCPIASPAVPDPARSRPILTDLARASPPQEILDFQKKQEVPANVEKAFRLFDTDRSGDIDSTELRKALQHLGMEADSAQTREVMRKYDRAGRGKLGLDEFNKLVQELLEFQKKQGIGPKDEPYGKGAAKDGALTLPLKIVAFG